MSYKTESQTSYTQAIAVAAIAAANYMRTRGGQAGPPPLEDLSVPHYLMDRHRRRTQPSRQSKLSLRRPRLPWRLLPKTPFKNQPPPSFTPYDPWDPFSSPNPNYMQYKKKRVRVTKKGTLTSGKKYSRSKGPNTRMTLRKRPSGKKGKRRSF